MNAIEIFFDLLVPPTAGNCIDDLDTPIPPDAFEVPDVGEKVAWPFAAQEQPADEFDEDQKCLVLQAVAGGVQQFPECLVIGKMGIRAMVGNVALRNEFIADQAA